MEERDPCLPSPCGPFSECRVVNGHAVCSCQRNYIGAPPACRPECTVSSECSQDRACIGQKCKDPCPGTCGPHARCKVINHNPICSCPPNYSGDPFQLCVEESKIYFPFFSKTVHLNCTVLGAIFSTYNYFLNLILIQENLYQNHLATHVYHLHVDQTLNVEI